MSARKTFPNNSNVATRRNNNVMISCDMD
jgi:hypothetical protein